MSSALPLKWKREIGLLGRSGIMLMRHVQVFLRFENTELCFGSPCSDRARSWGTGALGGLWARLPGGCVWPVCAVHSCIPVHSTSHLGWKVSFARITAFRDQLTSSLLLHTCRLHLHFSSVLRQVLEKCFLF